MQMTLDSMNDDQSEYFLQRLIDQLNNHKMNHLYDLQVHVNKQCLLHDRHRTSVNK